MAKNDKDITEKHLEDYPDVFADIVNTLLFKGKRLISPTDLVSVPPRSAYKSDGELHGQ